jgi:hypothetical protein
VPFPSLTFAELLENSTRAELEQFVSLLQGYLSAQHNDDGSHGTITASGDITGEGDGTFDGNVTADADGTPVEIGNGVGDGGSYSASPGIRMTYSDTHDWAVMLGDNFYAGSSRPGMVWKDCANVSADGTDGFMVLYRSTAVGVTSSEYYLIPATSLNLIYLGADTLGRRIAELNSLLVRATNGYYERGRTAPVGEWTSRTGANFNAADFTASTGNWTVDSADAITYASSIVGKTMTVAFEIVSTDVSATPTELQLVIPGGFTAAKKVRNPVIVSDAGGAAVISYAQVAASGTVISVFPTVNGGNWTLTAGDNTAVIGTITFEVQ